MKLIKQLLARNEVYTTDTNAIIDKYRDTLDVAFDNIVASRMDIDWTAIDFHPANRMLVNVMGNATHKIGETIRSNSDEPIFIDATNVANYSRTMRFLLPLDSISIGDTDSLIQFLKEYSVLVEEFSQDQLEVAVGDIGFLKDNFTIFSAKFKDVKIERVVLHEGFNLTDFDLDEVQLAQLKLLRLEGQA